MRSFLQGFFGKSSEIRMKLSYEDSSGGVMKQKTLDKIKKKKVTHLDLHLCSNLSRLPEDLPESIINLIGSSSLRIITKLPINLEALHLKCRNLSTLPTLPNTLKILDLEGAWKLKKIDEFPEGLIEVNLSECIALNELPEKFPESVVSIDLSKCNKLTSIPKLPKNLTKLNLSGCKQFEIIDVLPSGLTHLYLDSMTSLKTLPKLPETIIELSLQYSFYLEELPEELPNNLQNINLRNCNSLRRIPKLPDSLYNIDFSGCTNLTELPEFLPPRVSDLILSSCSNLEEFPANFLSLEGSRIRKLDLIGCSKLRNLPVLRNTGLINVNLSRCSSLTELPELPNTVITLNLGNCSSLTTLPPTLFSLPGLKELNLSGCSGLVRTEELDLKLRKLSDRCRVALPNHFYEKEDIKSAKDRCAKVLAEYNKNNPGGAPEFQKLLKRYMGEDLGMRNEKEISKSVNDILDIFEKNPSHIEWAERISIYYVGDGCINRPVAGFNQIAAFASILNQETLEQKMNAAKQLMVMEYVDKYVSEAKKPTGERVEIEAGNVLLGKIHQKFLSDKKIEKPWIGISDGNDIAYIGAVKDWVNKEFANAYKGATKILSQPESDLHDYLLNYVVTDTVKVIDVFARIAFPDHVQEIEDRFKEDKKELEDLMNVPEDPLSRESKAKWLEEGDDEKDLETEDGRLEFLGKKYKSLSKKKEAVIKNMAKAMLSKTPPSPAHNPNHAHHNQVIAQRDNAHRL